MQIHKNMIACSGNFKKFHLIGTEYKLEQVGHKPDEESRSQIIKGYTN